jgi:hypothetical protein
MILDRIDPNMNVIDSNILERDASGKPLHTFPHPVPDFALLLQQCLHAGKAVNRNAPVTCSSGLAISSA